MTPGTICLAYLHPGEVAHSFMHSMRQHFWYDLNNNRRMVAYIAEECGAGRITDGRNSAATRFLATDAEWLVFVDADMGFDADAVDRLIEAAHPTDRPIVGALAFAQRKGPPGPANSRRLEPVPTVYRWVDTDTIAGVAPLYDYPPNQLVECDATGCALLVIHRSVLEKIAETFPAPRIWFDETIYKGKVFGEDLTFCRRAVESGFPVHVHTGVQTSHYKHTYLTEENTPDVTAVPTYVVIPMRNRMDLTRSLLRQLVEQDEHEAIFVFDNGSNRKTKNELATLGMPRVEVFDADDADSLHVMWNRGIEEAVRRSWPCNVAILNNDLEVGERFLSGLSTALRSDATLGVVGPNYDGREGDGVQYVTDICAGRYDGTGGLPGFALMLKGESGYRFPETLKWWYGDNHLVASCLYGGSQVGIVLDTTVVHVDGGGQTGNWDDPGMVKVLEADRAEFARLVGEAVPA